METVEGRLASFKLQPARRKVNEAHAAAGAWPHHPKHFSVTPKSLSNAGFYHDPTESAPDNVTCVYCNKGLEGWEDGDDALDEHLKRVIDKATGAKCPWATVMGIKRDFDLFGPNEYEEGRHDPSAASILAARLGTFGDWWPFDNKKGWNPTSRKLAMAGFYNSPQIDALDTCACAYCDVILDGWSKNDDPEEEHRSRQANCFFFVARDLTKHETRDFGLTKSTSKISTDKNPPLRSSRSRKQKQPTEQDTTANEIEDGLASVLGRKDPSTVAVKAPKSKKTAKARTNTVKSMTMAAGSDALYDATQADDGLDVKTTTHDSKVPASGSEIPPAKPNKVQRSKSGISVKKNKRSEKKLAKTGSGAVFDILDMAQDEIEAQNDQEDGPSPPAKRLTRSTRSIKTDKLDAKQPLIDEPTVTYLASLTDSAEKVTLLPISPSEAAEERYEVFETSDNERRQLSASMPEAVRPFGHPITVSGLSVSDAPFASGSSKSKAESETLEDQASSAETKEGLRTPPEISQVSVKSTRIESEPTKYSENGTTEVRRGLSRSTSRLTEAGRTPLQRASAQPMAPTALTPDIARSSNEEPNTQKTVVVEDSDSCHSLDALAVQSSGVPGDNASGQSGDAVETSHRLVTTALKGFPERATSTSSTTHAYSRQEPIINSIQRGQSALDLLLARPIPTFASPDRISVPVAMTLAASTFSKHHHSGALTYEGATGAAQIGKQPDEAMKIREWISSLQDEHIKQFRKNSQTLLRDYEARVQNQRKELVQLVKRQCSTPKAQLDVRL